MRTARPVLTAHIAIGVSAAALSWPADAPAVETRFWHVDGRGEFEEGEIDGLSVDADGVVRLAPAATRLVESEDVYFWRVVESGGRIVVGSGDGGKVYTLDGSSLRELADLDMLEVMALAVGPDGTVFAGGAPGGVVYAIRDGEIEPYFDTEQGVVWDVAVGNDGVVYVATGESGRLYRVSGAGEGELLHESVDAHVMCVTISPSGDLIVGTAGDGLVLRVTPGEDVRVLYDASEDEVRSIVVAPNGTIYAAVNTARKNGDGDDTGRPALYRIGEHGTAQRLWRGRSELVFALALGRDGKILVGTGEKAAVHEVEPSTRRSARLAEFDERSVLALVPTGDGLLVGTGDPARIYRLGQRSRERGEIASIVRDAGAEARWNRLRWMGTRPSGTDVRFETRTGNKETPDDTWNEWAPAVADEGAFSVSSPPARFFQWKLVLEGTGRSSPEVARVVTSYREVNLSPEIAALDVSRKGAELFTGAENRTRTVRQTLPGGVEVDYTLPFETGGGPVAPGNIGWALGLRTVSWVATDANGDELVFALHYRPIESDRWMLLAEEITDLVYTWETSTFPDGDYVVRVTASDERSNAERDARSEARVSSTFEIDNTAPTISSLGARLQGTEVRLRARAKDERSAIVRAEITFDGQAWRPVHPAGGLLDANAVELDLTLDAAKRASGDPILLRVFDEAGNRAVRRAFLE